MLTDEKLMLVASAVCNGAFTIDADELMLTQPLTIRLKLIELFNKVLVDLDALHKLKSIGVGLDAIADLRNLLDASVVRQDRLLALEGLKTPTLTDLDAGICVPQLVLPPAMETPPARETCVHVGPTKFAHTNFVRKRNADWAEQAKLAGYILQEYYS